MSKFKVVGEFPQPENPIVEYLTDETPPDGVMPRRELFRAFQDLLRPDSVFIAGPNEPRVDLPYRVFLANIMEQAGRPENSVEQWFRGNLLTLRIPVKRSICIPPSLPASLGEGEFFGAHDHAFVKFQEALEEARRVDGGVKPFHEEIDNFVVAEGSPGNRTEYGPDGQNPILVRNTFSPMSFAQPQTLRQVFNEVMHSLSRLDSPELKSIYQGIGFLNLGDEMFSEFATLRLILSYDQIPDAFKREMLRLYSIGLGIRPPAGSPDYIKWLSNIDRLNSLGLSVSANQSYQYGVETVAIKMAYSMYYLRTTLSRFLLANSDFRNRDIHAFANENLESQRSATREVNEVVLDYMNGGYFAKNVPLVPGEILQSAIPDIREVDYGDEPLYIAAFPTFAYQDNVGGRAGITYYRTPGDAGARIFIEYEDAEISVPAYLLYNPTDENTPFLGFDTTVRLPDGSDDSLRNHIVHVITQKRQEDGTFKNWHHELDFSEILPGA